jgi:hypothetical protein
VVRIDVDGCVPAASLWKSSASIAPRAPERQACAAAFLDAASGGTSMLFRRRKGDRLPPAHNSSVLPNQPGRTAGGGTSGDRGGETARRNASHLTCRGRGGRRPTDPTPGATKHAADRERKRGRPRSWETTHLMSFRPGGGAFNRVGRRTGRAHRLSFRRDEGGQASKGPFGRCEPLAAGRSAASCSGRKAR